jgi:hypothetical protein
VSVPTAAAVATALAHVLLHRVRLKSAAGLSAWCVLSVAVAAKPQSVHLNLTQCKPPWVISVQIATLRSVNAKKTAKKPSKLAWSVVHAHLAQPHAEAAQLVAVLAAVAQVAVIEAKVVEAADKSQRRCTKNACSFKGNPLKRLK